MSRNPSESIGRARMVGMAAMLCLPMAAMAGVDDANAIPVLESGRNAYGIVVEALPPKEVNELEPLRVGIAAMNEGPHELTTVELVDEIANNYNLEFELRRTDGWRKQYSERQETSRTIRMLFLKPGERAEGEFCASGCFFERLEPGEYTITVTLMFGGATSNYVQVRSDPTAFRVLRATDEEFSVTRLLVSQGWTDDQYLYPLLKTYQSYSAKYSTFLDRHPDHFMAPYVAYHLSRFCLAVGANSEAIQEVETFMPRLRPGSPLIDDFLLIRSKAELASEAPTSGRALMQDIVERFPYSESARDAIRALNELNRTSYEGVQSEMIKGRVLSLAKGEATSFPPEELLRDLDSGDPSLRGLAARHLGRLGHKAAVPKLIEALADTATTVRWQAAWGLGILGDRQAVESLISALSDPEVDVRVQAARALGQLGDTKACAALTLALADSNVIVRWRAGEAMGLLGGSCGMNLVHALRSEEWETRMASAIGLGVAKESPHRTGLVEALSDENDQVAMMAAWALGELGDPAASMPLANTASSETRGDLVRLDVRSEAFWALERMGSPAVEPVMGILKHDRLLKSRRMAAEALGVLGDGKAVEELVLTLSDSDERLRWRAAWALGKIGDSRAIDPLIAALSDRESVVRRWAARALGNFKDDKAVEALGAVLEDKSEAVREEGRISIGKIQGE